MALHVYRHVNEMKAFEKIKKSQVESMFLNSRPCEFIKKYGPNIGIDQIPDELFREEFLDPCVTESNVLSKLLDVENILAEHDVPIHFNLYGLNEKFVRVNVSTTGESLTVKRLTGAVTFLFQSKTLQPKNHADTYSLLLSKVDNDLQFHCSVILNVGEMCFHNEEKLHVAKTMEELAQMVETSIDSLTDLQQNVSQSSCSEQNKKKAIVMWWRSTHVCRACCKAFVRLDRFKHHISSCTGGHVSSIQFSTEPALEYFSPSEYNRTLKCPIVCALDTEASCIDEIKRRIRKNGEIYKSDQLKIGQMSMFAVTASVVVRPFPELSYSIYKDVSFTNAQLLKVTIPHWKMCKLSVEDSNILETAVNSFRKAMNKFVLVKKKKLDLLDQKEDMLADSLFTDPESSEINDQLAAVDFQLIEARNEASRMFGIYFMELFQICINVTQRFVLMKQKKYLTLSHSRRIHFIQSYTSEVQKLIESGHYLEVERRSVGTEVSGDAVVENIVEKTFGRIDGFANVNLTNHVKLHPELNCCICNVKLDPIYLLKLEKWHVLQKLRTSRSKEGEMQGEEEAFAWNLESEIYQLPDGLEEQKGDTVETDEEDFLIINGRAVSDDSEKFHPKQRKEGDGPVIHPNVKSPHLNLWKGRNQWLVKSNLNRFVISHLSLFKQTLENLAHDIRSGNEGEEKYVCNYPETGLFAKDESDEDLEVIENLEDLERNYFVKSSDDNVKCVPKSLWKVTRPYDDSTMEELVDLLYCYVEFSVVLQQLCKAFDVTRRSITIAKMKTAKEFCNEAGKEYSTIHSKDKTSGRVYWAIDEKTYVELFETVMYLVGLLDNGDDYECSSEEDEGTGEDTRRAKECLTLNNYGPKTIAERIDKIKVSGDQKSVLKTKSSKDLRELEAKIHEERFQILKEALLDSLCISFPKYQFELRHFFKLHAGKIEDSNLAKYYLTILVIHHNHYFPKDEPIGFAHQTCNIKCYEKGKPNTRIFVHNLSNYDSPFLLKMIPPNVMAYKGKNLSNEWKIINDGNNKHKVKILITPFGSISDSMNFFAQPMSKLASLLTSEDMKTLYQMHLRYFKTVKTFRQALEKREREGNAFTYEMFAKMFRGKLIFPYDSVTDLDWLFRESDELPPMEEFLDNTLKKDFGDRLLSKEELERKRQKSREEFQVPYDNMKKIYKFFECKNMSDLSHLYTLEDGIILALAMSSAFLVLHKDTGVDATNFFSTARYTYTTMKRNTGAIFQTVPNGRVYQCLKQMKRAGFSQIKRQISVASPKSEHVRECHFSESCDQCRPFFKADLNPELTSKLIKESENLLEKAPANTRCLVEKMTRAEKDEWQKFDGNRQQMLEEFERLQSEHVDMMKMVKNVIEEKCSGDASKLDDEVIAVRQACLMYMDENNNYGSALKKPLPVANFTFVRPEPGKGEGGKLDEKFLVDIYREQQKELERFPDGKVIDYYCCVDLELPDTATQSKKMRAADFNVLVRNQLPDLKKLFRKNVAYRT